MYCRCMLSSMTAAAASPGKWVSRSAMPGGGGGGGTQTHFLPEAERNNNSITYAGGGGERGVVDMNNPTASLKGGGEGVTSQ